MKCLFGIFIKKKSLNNISQNAKRNLIGERFGLMILYSWIISVYNYWIIKMNYKAILSLPLTETDGV